MTELRDLREDWSFYSYLWKIVFQCIERVFIRGRWQEKNDDKTPRELFLDLASIVFHWKTVIFNNNNCWERTGSVIYWTENYSQIFLFLFWKIFSLELLFKMIQFNSAIIFNDNGINFLCKCCNNPNFFFLVLKNMTIFSCWMPNAVYRVDFSALSLQFHGNKTVVKMQRSQCTRKENLAMTRAQS